MANKPTSNVTICDNCNSFLCVNSFLENLEIISVTIFPEAAIKQLSAVERIAEK